MRICTWKCQQNVQTSNSVNSLRPYGVNWVNIGSGAWQYQAIAWTDAYFSSVRSTEIHSSEGNFTGVTSAINKKNNLKITFIQIS